MQYLISRAERAGSHFFDKEAMRFFHSRLLPATLTKLNDHTFRFVTSERMDDTEPRTYTVREVKFYYVPDNNGTPREHVEHNTIGEFREHKTAVQARKHLRDEA